MEIIVKGNLTEQEHEQLRYLLTDALGEFMSAREGDYVERRYGARDAWFKEQKREQVTQRLSLAKRLLDAAFNVGIVCECCEKPQAECDQEKADIWNHNHLDEG